MLQTNALCKCNQPKTLFFSDIESFKGLFLEEKMISAKRRYSEAERTFETLKVELTVAAAEEQSAKAAERTTLALRVLKVRSRDVAFE